MAKALMSPILFVLLGLVICHFLLYRNWRKSDRWRRSGLLLLTAATALLWAMSTPTLAARWAERLESTYAAGTPDWAATKVDVVVVLSGGYGPGPTRETDLLGDASFARVARGVQAFRQSKARLLVVSGRSPDGEPTRMTELMKEFAVAMGVPAAQVRTEPRSPNTFAHPMELAKLPEIQRTDTVAVVTSAWHLRRAMGEFERHFEQVVAVPADFLSFTGRPGPLAWLPQAEALRTATLVLHEQIGAVWYALRHLLGRIAGS